MKRSRIALATTAGLVGGLLIAQGPASAVECDRYVVSTDPGLVTAAEYDQLREGMTLDQVQALFGSPGAISNAYESSYSKSMDVTWVGAVTIDYWWWEGSTPDWTVPEIEAHFSMSKATAKTTYKRKKVKVKNVKRAKRHGLKTWRWKTVKVKKAVPATPYTVDYFSLSSAEILRQTATLECSTY